MLLLVSLKLEARSQLVRQKRVLIHITRKREKRGKKNNRCIVVDFLDLSKTYVFFYLVRTVYVVNVIAIDECLNSSHADTLLFFDAFSSNTIPFPHISIKMVSFFLCSQRDRYRRMIEP